MNQPLNQILYGPPGTGKTYATTELAVQIADPKWYASVTENNPIEHRKIIKEKYDELIKAKQIAFTTFHQSFSYEDFIEGLKAYIPEDEKNIAYKVEDGIFKRIAVAATKSQSIHQTDIEVLNTSEVTLDQNHNYVLVIDEINRGNISKIFGELITLIEDDKRAGQSDARELTLPYSKEPFTVPSNLYLIGTMNTADKSLTQLDLALRRRFEFKEISPDIKILENLEASQHGVDMPKMLEIMNKRIQYLKGKDYQIGHSYFMPLCKKMDEADYLHTLQKIFKNKIIPLLQEYFFSNLKHIGLVLNDNPNGGQKVIKDIDSDENIFRYEQQQKANPLYAVELNVGCFNTLTRFQQIYQ